MGGLLETLTDVFNGGPIIRRRQRTAGVESRDLESLAEMLALTRGHRSYAGVHVNDDMAMTLGAVFACVDLLSELVSTLPVDEYRHSSAGPPKLVPSSTLLVDPTGDGSGVEVWLRQVMTSLLLRGNAYGLVTELDDEVRPRHIEILYPDRISTRRMRNQGGVDFFIDGKPIDRWPDGPLWHMQGYSIPGYPLGLSAIQYAKETIGQGLAIRKFGSQWFGDGAHPTSVFEHDTEPMPSEADAKRLKQSVMKAMHDNREPLFTGGGWKLKAIQVKPEESQFLESAQANVADVARYFRVPPEMIGGKAADNLTYANQEQRSISLLTFTVNPWLVRLERALSRLRPRGRFVKFNADALLRVDLKTRYEAHVLAVRGGFATPNERRLLEDMTALPGADELLWPPFSTGSSNGGADEGAQPA